MKRFTTSLLALCALTLSLSAKPARRDAISLTQPDGTQLTAFLHGDAYYHYYTDAYGNMLQRDAEGFYQATAMPSDDELQARRQSSPRMVARQRMVGSELNLAPRGLIILVSFTDLAFSTPQAEMDSMLNGQNYNRLYAFRDNGRLRQVMSSGSARQYFQDNSLGQYNPVFDVVGPVTVSKGYAYYGGNDYSGNDKNPEKMVQEACQLVNDEVDFTLYDNDNDGTVDFVYVIYAGYGESDGAGDDYIWPHSYALSYGGVSCVVDGMHVESYACSNEIDYFNRKHDGIGTFCHEFSHVLGMPDLYATDNSYHKTMGQWDIMDYGPYNNDGNTPPNYSAYERFFFGWLTPRLVNSACDVQLAALHESNDAVLMTSSGQHNMNGLSPNPTTFYMFENRQKSGWDAHLPAHGMLITRVAYSSYKWSSNIVNNTKSSMGVDIIEADGLAPDYDYSGADRGYFGKEGDTYPAGATTFTKLSAFKVTDIEETEGLITFKVNGGNPVPLAVENAEQPSGTQIRKVIREGQLLIEHNGAYYNLLGNTY